MPSVELANECGWAVLARFKLLTETGLGANPRVSTYQLGNLEKAL